MRVNIEDDLYLSGRLGRLARAMGWNERESLGALTLVWRATQAERLSSTTVERLVTVVGVWFDDDQQCERFIRAMAISRLAQIDGETITINGNEQQIMRLDAWLEQKREAGRRSAASRKAQSKRERPLNERSTTPERPSTEVNSPVSLLLSPVSFSEDKNRIPIQGSIALAPQNGIALTAPPSAPAVVEKKRSPDQKARSVEVNRRYRERYEQTVGKPPSGIDQAFNGMIARFADKHAENALAIVDQYFDSPNGFYRLKGWPVQLLIDSAPALWREVDDARAAQENIAAPAQQRIDARNASADIELEKAQAILAERRAAR